MKKVISIACAVGIAGMLIGCGGDDNGGVVTTSPTDTVVMDKTTVGSDTVALSPTSSDVTSDTYAYTTSDLGLVALVQNSTPVDVSADETLDDNETDAVLNSIDTTEPLIVSAKIAKKPIRSEDKIVTILPKFDPKLPFDTSVAVTNYKSLLALPNNGLDLLNQNLAPVPIVSSDIAFFDTNGKRIWDINQKLASAESNVSFYLIFDPEKSGLNEGTYKLAVYKNGQYEIKDINVTKKSDGTLSIALEGAYPFVIAKEGGVITKDGVISNPYENTAFKLAVVALDENGSVVGVGKVENNALSLKAINEPAKYQLVSYILKNNKVETNSTEIEITADMLNPAYPLVDNMSDNDINAISQIKNQITNNVNDVTVNDFLNVQDAFCETNYPSYPTNLCDDFKNTVNSIFDVNATDSLDGNYSSDDEYSYSCNIVNKTVDNNNTTITISCASSYETEVSTINIKTTDGITYSVSYNVKNTYSEGSGGYTENGSFEYVKNGMNKYVNNVKDVLVSSSSSNEQGYVSNYSNQYTTTINYINDKYVYTQSGSLNDEYSYQESGEPVNEKKSFSYELSATYDAIDTNSEDYTKFSAKVYNIYSNEENITINGKMLAVTKDENGGWHINMSVKGY